MSDLIAGARTNPGALTYASVGVGSGAHLLGEMLKSEHGINIVHAPYRGSSQIVPDLLSNRIGLFFGAVGSMAPLIQEGKLRALMVTDRQRSSLIPNAPSAVEAGTPTLDLKVWFGVFVPAGTSTSVVERLNAEFVRALDQPETKQRLTQLGANIKANSPKEFADVIATDSVRLGKVVKNAGARVE
jgi:tripartite-type tricarboxylate transporter receptor subunit TctC